MRKFLKTIVGRAVGAFSLLEAGVGLKEADLAIAGGKLVDLYTRATFKGAVLVSGGIIAEVKEGYDADAKDVIDGEGLTVLPGLVDLVSFRRHYNGSQEGDNIIKPMAANVPSIP